MRLEQKCSLDFANAITTMSRRRDLIRFGEFTSGSWEFKEPSEEFRRLFSIPTGALDANPNLQQKTGY